ncbi:MAG: tRNA lysidine(34) synthetase TilS [Vulcanimicrobiaceae bacterium]
MRGAAPQRAVLDAVRHSGVLHRGERIVVACSGGPDSVALAALLSALAGEFDLDLCLVHVNHGLRADAWQDECVALRVGAALDLPVTVEALEPTAGDEAGLREARYAALVRVAQARGAPAVATGHHARDQAETVLLALFRGAGADGLAGMAPRRPLAAGCELIRPLLRVPPADLRAICRAQVLPYALDPTNSRLHLRRNAVRAALAQLRPLFPGLDEAVARAAEVVRDEHAGSARAVLREQIRAMLRERVGLRDVDFAHVEAAVRGVEAGQRGRFRVRKGVELLIEPRGKRER